MAKASLATWRGERGIRRGRDASAPNPASRGGKPGRVKERNKAGRKGESGERPSDGAGDGWEPGRQQRVLPPMLKPTGRWMGRNENSVYKGQFLKEVTG